MATIEELLKSMYTLSSDSKGDFIGLQNNKATWERIANRDSFSELGFESESAKEEWLKEWIDQNPYLSIS